MSCHYCTVVFHLHIILLQAPVLTSISHTSIDTSSAKMTSVKHERASQPISPPAPPKPQCSSCHRGGQNLKKLTTMTSNRNGNAKRPYLKCLPCDKFVTFWDDRGTHSVNPKCGCHIPSRLQVDGFYKGRNLHFVCGTGHCSFYEIARDDQDRPLNLADDSILKFAARRLI